MTETNREEEIRAASAADHRRARRNTWIFIALFVLAIVVLVFATAPSFAHCTGVEHVGVCVDQRIGGQN